MKRILTRIAAIGMAVGVFGGCTASATPSPVPATPTAATSAAPTTPASFSPSTLPKAETTTITFSEGGIDPGTFMVRLAFDAGLLDKYGLQGKEVTFNGATQVIQALIAKQLNAAVSTSSQTILTMGTSDPAVDVASFSSKLPDYLYAAPGLKTAADIKGKKAAVSTLGSQAYQEVIVGMMQLGLKPADMTIVPIGGQSARVAALSAGTVAIAAADPALEAKLAASGILPIVKLPEVPGVELAGVNLMLLRSFVTANPGTTIRLVAAVLEANAMFTSDPKAVVSYYAKWAQLSEAEAKAGIDIYIKNGLNPTLYATDNAYKTAQTVAAGLTPDVAAYDMAKVHDFSFLDTLKKNGLFKQLGLPAN